MSFDELVENVGKGMDLAGVAAIVLGTILATVFFLSALRRGQQSQGAYRGYRQGIGRSILLGLELLVAADIIRTVAVSPTFTSVGVLAIIILIRTFLSFTLQLELEGRWPWQPRRGSGAEA
ncbi:MAG TPA: DUF1622 domain-containing protein [Gaiellaceae bacterium]|nr:DUF1622 domain-containing protein [Gaiellaceae bacterium]